MRPLQRKKQVQNGVGNLLLKILVNSLLRAKVIPFKTSKEKSRTTRE